MSFANGLGGSLPKAKKGFSNPKIIFKIFILLLKSMMNCIYQILKYILNLLWRETEKERERDRHRITSLVHNLCLRTLPSIFSREEWGKYMIHLTIYFLLDLCYDLEVLISCMFIKLFSHLVCLPIFYFVKYV